MPAILHFAIDTPLRRVFDYLPAVAGTETLRPGQRAWLPFGKRRVMGMLINTGTHSDVPHNKLRRIAEIIDDEPVFDATLLGTLQWAADYYHHPIGEVIASALPVALRDGAPQSATEAHWRLTAQGKLAITSLSSRATRLQALCAILADNDLHSDQQLKEHREALRTLLKRGDVECVNIKPDAIAIQ